MMKKIILGAMFFLMSTAISSATEEKILPCRDGDYEQLNFWVGTWRAEWDGGMGTNTIVKSHNDCIVNENFQSPTLNGISISMYDSITNQWRQTWMDDQGGFYDFYGKKDGDDYIFHTLPTKDQPLIYQRMLFTNIEKNHFNWLWQKTSDNGKSWEEIWQINYSRIK